MSSLNSNSVSTKVLYSLGVAMGVSALSGASYWCYNSFIKKDVMPEQWLRVGTLDQINVYPLKSGAPLKLQAETEVACELLSARVNSFRDRGLMLIDADHKMVSARAYPRMILIQPRMLSDTTLLLEAPDMNSLELDFDKLKAEAETADKYASTTLWGSKVPISLCGPKYDQWFSQFILNEASGLHLAYFPFEQPKKAISSSLTSEPFFTKTDVGALNDSSSYMLINLASVDDLNPRLKRPVNAQQFRGNFHVKMDVPEAYVENSWAWIRIGDAAVFRNVAPCTRCIMPNVNVFTGERDPEQEPLRTLRSYRQWQNYSSPTFGVHMGLRQTGVIKANDVVYVGVK